MHGKWVAWVSVPEGLVWLFQILPISWDFNTQPSLEFKQNGVELINTLININAIMWQGNMWNIDTQAHLYGGLYVPNKGINIIPKKSKRNSENTTTNKNQNIKPKNITAKSKGKG